MAKANFVTQLVDICLGFALANVYWLPGEATFVCNASVAWMLSFWLRTAFEGGFV